MQLILPELLATAKGLSLGAAALLWAVGMLLWAAGWRWHRFWIVFGITLGAGLIGLGAGRAAGGQQVLVVGVLLAVSAGMLALELAKVLAFLTGGVAAWVGVQALVPQAQELWAVFLSGGLIGVVLYRFWTMLTTSFVGVMIAAHAGLIFVAEFLKVDTAEWSAGKTSALNGAVIAATLLGVVVQTRTAQKPAEEAAAAGDAGSEVVPLPTLLSASPEPGRVPWWRLKAG